MARNYQVQVMSSVFKSREPKISIYQQMERKERDLGPKTTSNLGKKYQIKLNDEVLDADSLTAGGTSSKGHLK